MKYWTEDPDIFTVDGEELDGIRFGRVCYIAEMPSGRFEFRDGSDGAFSCGILTAAEAIEALREAIAWIEERARADAANR